MSRARTSFAIAAFVALVLLVRAATAAEPILDVGTCEGCHAASTDARLTFPDGTWLPAFVDHTALADSVHGQRFECRDCHRETGAWPHEPPPFAGAAEYRRGQTDVCKRCHAEHFEALSDGIHFREVLAGNPLAPTCVDCHGAHGVVSPGEARPGAAALCGQCHEAEARDYGRSIHAESLTKGGQDAPGCTDCHGAHRVDDTDEPGWHAASYTLCARCHGDATLMQKYELSQNIVSSYLEDFHGSSNHLYQQVGHVPERPVATCGDCHGYHDVRRLRDGADEATVRGRVEEMCRKCHEQAPEGFSAAWLSHDTPGPTRAPLVWGISWGYRLLIPLMLLGLVIHILLHLWRLPLARHGSHGRHGREERS